MKWIKFFTKTLLLKKHYCNPEIRLIHWKTGCLTSEFWQASHILSMVHQWSPDSRRNCWFQVPKGSQKPKLTELSQQINRWCLQVSSKKKQKTDINVIKVLRNKTEATKSSRILEALFLITRELSKEKFEKQICEPTVSKRNYIDQHLCDQHIFAWVAAFGGSPRRSGLGNNSKRKGIPFSHKSVHIQIHHMKGIPWNEMKIQGNMLQRSWRMEKIQDEDNTITFQSTWSAKWFHWR